MEKVQQFVIDLEKAGACPALINQILFKVKTNKNIKEEIEVIVNNFQCNECNACEL